MVCFIYHHDRWMDGIFFSGIHVYMEHKNLPRPIGLRTQEVLFLQPDEGINIYVNVVLYYWFSLETCVGSKI